MLVILACYAAGVLSTVRAAFPSQIVVARTADVDSELTAQTEEWAAAQLALLFNLPIVELLPNTTTSSMCSTIAVGYGASVALGLAPEALNSLGADEFKLTTLEHLNSVAVGSAHDSPRGAMYGALELARALGFEIFREGEVAKPAVWPPAAGLPSASGLDRQHTPPFLDRSVMNTLLRPLKGAVSTTRKLFFNSSAFNECKIAAVQAGIKCSLTSLLSTEVGGCYAYMEPLIGRPVQPPPYTTTTARPLHDHYTRNLCHAQQCYPS